MFVALLGALVGLPLVSRAVDTLKVFRTGDPIVASEVNENLAKLREAINALETANAQVPIGTIVAFAGRKARIPDGWLLCDGRGASSTDYRDLHAVLETAWGDGSTRCSDSCDFNLPDLRGAFLRGVADSTNRDPDAVARVSSAPGGHEGDDVGTLQESAVGPHAHYYDFTNGGVGGDNSGMLTGTVGQADGATVIKTAGPGMATESRPMNLAVNYIIRY